MFTIGTEREESLISSFVHLLERLSFDEIKRYLNNLEKTNPYEYNIIYYWIYSDEIFAKISDHKIALADILTSASRVVALPEDRTRIVFFFALLQNTSLNDANKIFAREFGPRFKIFPNYNIGRQTLPWTELVKKAAEIVNGFNNYHYFRVDHIVQDILGFYKTFHYDDPETLEKLGHLTEKIIADINKNPDAPLDSKMMAETTQKISELFKLTNHLEMNGEIEKNYENISRFIFLTRYSCETKLILLQNNVPLDRYDVAEKMLLNEFGTILTLQEISLEEEKRFGQPIQPIVPSNPLTTKTS